MINLNKKSLKEANADYQWEFEKKLSDAGLIFASKGKPAKVSIDFSKDPKNFMKARELADEVKDELGGDYRIGMDSSGRATFEFTDKPIVHDDYSEEPVRAGELTNEMKSIIEDMAEADYETGHPLSPEDALDWFESGEEEAVPVELAHEAADYYFDAFDEVRSHSEDDSYFDDELEESKKSNKKPIRESSDIYLREASDATEQAVNDLKGIWEECKDRFGFRNPVKSWPSVELRDAICDLEAASSAAEIDAAVSWLDDVADDFFGNPDEAVSAYADEIWDAIADIRQAN